MNLVLKVSKMLTLIALVAMSWACDQNDTDLDPKNEVAGKWQLNKISGGITGSGYQADWNYLELKTDLTYRRLQNTTLKYQGTYELVQKDGKTFIKFKESATPSNAAFEGQAKEVSFDKDKFILSDPCCDLFQYEFAKAIN